MNWTTFISRVRHLALEASSLDDAFRLGCQYGLLRRCNHDGTYEDVAFEEALFARIADSLPNGPTTPRPEVLHIFTETYPVGGHTRLALEWIRIRQGKERQSVLFTRAAHPMTVQALGRMAIPHYVATGRPMERLAHILQHVGGARTIILHIHPEDCIAAMAARLLHACGARVLFVNHADHVFSFGMSAASAVLEVSGFGWAMTERKRRAASQSFLGIPLPEGSSSPIASQNTRATPRDLAGPVLSVGAPLKYRPGGGMSFADLLNRLTAAVDHEFHLIGPDGTEDWWRDLTDRARQKVRFFGPLPLEEARRRMRECAAYVDSFPMPGGSAFQEAFMLGAPSFGLLVGAGGYGLVDCLRSRTLDDLVAALAVLLDAGEPATGREGDDQLRARILDEFSDAAMSRRIAAALAGEGVPLPSELADAAGDLAHFESAWLEQGPELVVVQSEIPGIAPRAALLWAMAACKGGHIGMSRKALLKFAAGMTEA